MNRSIPRRHRAVLAMMLMGVVPGALAGELPPCEFEIGQWPPSFDLGDTGCAIEIRPPEITQEINATIEVGPEGGFMAFNLVLDPRLLSPTGLQNWVRVFELEFTHSPGLADSLGFLWIEISFPVDGTFWMRVTRARQDATMHEPVAIASQVLPIPPCARVRGLWEPTSALRHSGGLQLLLSEPGHCMAPDHDTAELRHMKFMEVRKPIRLRLGGLAFIANGEQQLDPGVAYVYLFDAL